MSKYSRTTINSAARRLIGQLANAASGICFDRRNINDVFIVGAVPAFAGSGGNKITVRDIGRQVDRLGLD